ncbi:MAG: HAMP domain-containing sensor histidine kinase [Alcanivoracaceae bacterium]|jgi:two-component system CAI-1 autoinducer sensor kinase/phosphatase CqsS|nr:HAMP domain-containing sensor histidine kinase [Alcanivoracaceae bacterium]
MIKPRFWMQALTGRLVKSIVESAHYSRFNAPMVGVLGLVGFPLYYYIWHDLFPQPYENLELRIAGMLVCLPLLFYNLWPERLQRRFAIYWLMVLLYTLPFFFTYMLLRNQMSIVWSMSIMAALFLLVLAVYDWLMVAIISVTGSAAAWLAYYLTADQIIPFSDYLQQLPIYLFVVVAGSIFNYSAQMVKEEKLDAYAAVGRNIAHELRTPLLGMKAATTALQRYMPDLEKAYRLARDANLPVTPIRNQRFDQLAQAADRIDDEIVYSNTIIDMLLLSAGQANIKSDDFRFCSIDRTIRLTLKRYPFKSEREQALVHWQPGEDFEYFGSDLLVTHILFNLIKNALHSVISAGKGDVTISSKRGRDMDQLTVRDTGPGIPPNEIRHIFDHFYTSKTVDQGSGVGLSFCRHVMESFGGTITCRSKMGHYTEFVMSFPSRNL